MKTIFPTGWMTRNCIAKRCVCPGGVGLKASGYNDERFWRGCAGPMDVLGMAEGPSTSIILSEKLGNEDKIEQ